MNIQSQSPVGSKYRTGELFVIDVIQKWTGMFRQANELLWEYASPSISEMKGESLTIHSSCCPFGTEIILFEDTVFFLGFNQMHIYGYIKIYDRELCFVQDSSIKRESIMRGKVHHSIQTIRKRTFLQEQNSNSFKRLSKFQTPDQDLVARFQFEHMFLWSYCTIVDTHTFKFIVSDCDMRAAPFRKSSENAPPYSFVVTTEEDGNPVTTNEDQMFEINDGQFVGFTSTTTNTPNGRIRATVVPMNIYQCRFSSNRPTVLIKTILTGPKNVSMIPGSSQDSMFVNQGKIFILHATQISMITISSDSWWFTQFEIDKNFVRSIENAHLYLCGDSMIAIEKHKRKPTVTVSRFSFDSRFLSIQTP